MGVWGVADDVDVIAIAKGDWMGDVLMGWRMDDGNAFISWLVGRRGWMVWTEYIYIHNMHCADMQC